MFGKLALPNITLDVYSGVITRWGSQIQGAHKGYNPKHHGRNSHHPLLAFVADYHLVANFWLRPGKAHTANNAIAFLDATLANLCKHLICCVIFHLITYQQTHLMNNISLT